MSSIVISYSRTHAAAARLSDRLRDYFGIGQVTLSVEALVKPDGDYQSDIRTAIDGAVALIVMIGPDWLDDLPEFDQIAIAAALQAGKLVIPVLVEDASMPPRERLPNKIAPLANHLGVMFSENSSDEAMSAIINALSKVITPVVVPEEASAPPAPAYAPQPFAPPVRGEIPDTLEGVAEAGDTPEPQDVPVPKMQTDTREEPEEEAEQIAEVLFSAYYPREAQVEGRYGLYLYAFADAFQDAIEHDVEKFREELGGDVPRPTAAKQTPSLKVGTSLTIVPESNELEFEPEALEKAWQGDWTRFGFEFRPEKKTAGETATIRISMQVSGVEIAHIKCAVEIIAQPQPEAQPENSIAAAKLTSTQSGLYQRIFVSYSRSDQPVVSAYRLAQLALGNDVFIDSYSIRAGEDWRAALGRAIDEADVFQLFWSENAAQSENIRDEWDYALKYRCPENRCVEFIRPVFWVQPLHPPPQELAHLNFRYVPLATIDTDEV